MPIREQGYYRWQGKIRDKFINWIPIAINGISYVFKKKKSKLLFYFASMPFFLFLVAIYIAEKPELVFLKRLIKQIQTDALLFKTYYTNGFLMFMLVILSLFAGAELISRDLKYKSLSLYLSRPLSRFDYLKGKFSTIIFYLLLFTLLPGYLLILAKLLFSAHFSISPVVIFGSFAYPLLFSLFFSSFVLMLSSLSSNSRFISIAFFGTYFVSDIIGSILYRSFHNEAYKLISIKELFINAGKFIFGVYDKTENITILILSLLIIAVLTIVFSGVLVYKINKAEV